MNSLVSIENGKASVDSKVIADAFGKIHRDVLRAIENLECSSDFRMRNFAPSTYTTEQGKVLPCIRMSRDGFCFLAMGFTGKNAARWKEEFIEAFNKLETIAAGKSKSAMDALGEAIEFFESDKEKASLHAKALAKWRSVRKEHIEAISDAHARAQLVLNFAS